MSTVKIEKRSVRPEHLRKRHLSDDEDEHEHSDQQQQQQQQQPPSQRPKSDNDSEGDEDTYRPFLTAKQLRQMHEHELRLRRKVAHSMEDEEEQFTAGPKAKVSLLEQTKQLQENPSVPVIHLPTVTLPTSEATLDGTVATEPAAESDTVVRAETNAAPLTAEEKRLIEEFQHGQAPLASNLELAKGIVYTEPLTSSWKPPKWAQAMSVADRAAVRQKYHIIVEGENLPPPLRSFAAMKFPQPVLDVLQRKGIKLPSPIQMQGIPVALTGRDMIGIAFTGSGKTITFCLPMIMFALEEERRMKLIQGEGPIGLVIVPSRELAAQIKDEITLFTDALAAAGEPALRTALCIGGLDVREQSQSFRNGVHMVVATPGRLYDMLQKKRLNLHLCKFLVLDEADRMMDLGFDEELKNIANFFDHQRQTLLFSATMPKKFQEFAKGALVKPVVVNVGRAGAASMDVIQEVEYVRDEQKLTYLLEVLQKTPPPVLIFCENKTDVDNIHEFLLLKGVRVCSVHGAREQEERLTAIREFKIGKRDVLVATDVASKGLDFPAIQHVINFDMPRDIENYVHRIGRTGRGGKTGIATTFINKMCSETVLLDLKHLLMEAKQKVPAILETLDDGGASQSFYGNGGGRECQFCGGLGHSILNCPKLEAQGKKMTAGYSRDDGGGAGDGGY